MLKAVLFDMDGVIVDTEPLHKKAYFKMFESFNIDVSTEMYEAFTGQSTINICRQLCDHFKLTCQPEDLVNSKRAFFKDLFYSDPDLDLIPGVRALIKNYYDNGLKLVLASSASMLTINNVFNRFELNSYFIGKISGADLKASKPHPEIFQKAAQMASEPVENCMVIEDSTSGIKAAKSANIYCVAFKSPNSKNQDYTLADQLITDFDEITYSKIRQKFVR
ncbi:HAD family phosphatase [Mesonia sp. K7]|uniref:HAD family hydrolase n=1 Tax=Mesonia sp. K7 TaxID=2218606 RepID=UPI000DA82B9E|nr:HAD family phosphatase [Mesonia sp. K7]PZD78803.1 HAD family phosphatase [Mesonia sp. K7]